MKSFHILVIVPLQAQSNTGEIDPGMDCSGFYFFFHGLSITPVGLSLALIDFCKTRTEFFACILMRFRDIIVLSRAFFLFLLILYHQLLIWLKRELNRRKIFPDNQKRLAAFLGERARIDKSWDGGIFT